MQMMQEKKKDGYSRESWKEKNIYCNIIRDYGKLREIAAKIINALDIKDEDADKVTVHDIKVLIVDDSHTMITIEWTEVFDGANICRSGNARVTEVPAEWFALDDGSLGPAIQTYKRSNKERIDNLEETLSKELEALDGMEQEVKSRREAIVGLKNDIAKLKREYY